MKIAYFNASFKKGQDGVTRVLYTMIESARSRGHEVIAVTSDLPDSVDRTVPMIKVPSVAFPLHRAYRIALPGYHSFAKKLQDYRPDIIHVNSPCPLGFAAIKYARDFNVPVVATYHTHFPTYPRYYRLRGLEEFAWKILRQFYCNIDRTFVPAQPILDELHSHKIGPLQYLPNGVDVHLFRPEYRSNEWRKEYTGSTDVPVVLFVSRLVWEKDIKILAEMYDRLVHKRSDFAMIVVGEGHARSDLEKLMPGARFLGYKSGLELAQCYASSDIFVFPSTTETFGLVTIEAMASGIVPVAAKVGGASGIIKEGESGIFARPHDAWDMARHVEFLLDHPEERNRLSDGALRRANSFRWEHILDRLFESYDEVIYEYQHNERRYAA